LDVRIASQLTKTWPAERESGPRLLANRTLAFFAVYNHSYQLGISKVVQKPVRALELAQTKN